MDHKEKEFLIKLLSTYKIEAEEHLKSLTEGLLTLEKHPSKEKDPLLLNTLFREAHSLKGASRAVGFHQIEKLCQLMESVLEEWKKGKLIPSPSFYDTFYSTIDWLTQQIRHSDYPETLSDPELFHVLLKKIVALLPSSSLPKERSVPKQEDPFTFVQKEKQIKEPFLENDTTVRVLSAKLDRLLLQAEEMLTAKLMLDEQKNEWKEIFQWLEGWEKEWEIPSVSSSYSFEEFFQTQKDFIRKLRERVQKHSNSALQKQRILTNLVDTLLEETKKVLMQPFKTLLEGFPRMIRDLSQSLKKEIHFHTIGEEIEMDRRILEALKDPLMHLVRNSADHGIETPGERVSKNKSPEGHITIQASQISGNCVEIIVSDDGRGIDEEGVKRMAIEKGLLQEKEGKELNKEQTLSLLLQSGLSTRPEVTEFSGRGLGLGIANEKVEKIGGKIKIETEKGKGTLFRMILPLTLATFRGIRIKHGSQEFIFPTQSVRQVLRFSLQEQKTLQGHPILHYQQETLPYFPLSELLSLSNVSTKETLSIALIVRAADRSIAIGIDEVLNEEEVLVKGVGHPLLRIKNISAATISESGKVIPILDPYDLIKTAMDQEKHLSAFSPAAYSSPLILIVEDSATTRYFLQNLLESAHYNVKTAKDGKEALEMLEKDKIDLMISDIEMPFFSGFELIEKIYQKQEHRTLPIILCSSKKSKEEETKGKEMGVKGYLDKHSFHPKELLDLIHELTKNRFL